MRVVLTGEKVSQMEEQRRLVQGMGLECSGGDCVPFERLSHRLAQAPAPGLVLVFMGKDADAAAQAIAQATSMSGAPVLAVAPAGKERWASFEKMGVQACVAPERLREGLGAAIDRMGVAVSAQARGKVIGVFSAHPGCGATTIATHLAFSLAAVHPDRVALIEAGYAVPEIALDLDLEVRHSFAELIRNHERMDPYMVRQVAMPHAAGVHVLAYAAATLAPVVIEPAMLQRLLALARGLYDVSILDLAHGLPAVTRAAIPLMEQVLIVFRPEVPSLRLTLAMLEQLRDADAPLERIRLVANRAGWRQQVDAREVEKFLTLPIHEWIPDEPATVIAALNEGKPLIQYRPRAKITRAIDRLAQTLLPRK